MKTFFDVVKVLDDEVINFLAEEFVERLLDVVDEEEGEKWRVEGTVKSLMLPAYADDCDIETLVGVSYNLHDILARDARNAKEENDNRYDMLRDCVTVFDLLQGCLEVMLLNTSQRAQAAAQATHAAKNPQTAACSEIGALLHR